jgi:hypothetical protein
MQGSKSTKAKARINIGLIQKGVRIYPPTVSVPYRFNANFSFKRKLYRTKTRTVFRDFNIKNLIL